MLEQLETRKANTEQEASSPQLFHGLQPGNSRAESVRFHLATCPNLYFPKTRPSGSLLARTSQGMSCLMLPPFTLNRSQEQQQVGAVGFYYCSKTVLHSTKCKALCAQRKENIMHKYKGAGGQRGFLQAEQHSPASQKPLVALDCARCSCRRPWWQWL